MTVPLFKALLAPSRRVRVTLPEVVGFQLKVVALPAVSWYPPEGMLKGFAFEPWAMAPAMKSARLEMRVNCMMIFDFWWVPLMQVLMQEALAARKSKQTNVASSK